MQSKLHAGSITGVNHDHHVSDSRVNLPTASTPVSRSSSRGRHLRIRSRDHKLKLYSLL